MTKRNPWRFGAALALTVLTGYTVCTVLWALFTEPSLVFMNALFHGLDFRVLHAGGAFAFGDWLLAALVLSTWAFLIGALFAAVSNRLEAATPSDVTHARA